ncbi:MAG: hypothetical protein J0I67_15010 [Bosea sp.]|nr:hypothetical protein [Bosea sp. (in: a-proteobacteria)]
MARPHIVVFGKPDWDGYKANVHSTILDLSDRKGHGELGTENWNDEINSFEIKSGIWKIYEHHSRGARRRRSLALAGTGHAISASPRIRLRVLR